jgi:membrane protease YdiL (CAAX protease family)
MSRIGTILRSRPVLSYYVLTFLISYTTLVLLMITRGLPATQAQMDAVLQLAIPFFLLGPLTAGLLMTGIVDGRQGFRNLGARLRSWRVGAGWYAIAILLAPVLILAQLMILSIFSPAFLPGIFTVEDKVPRLIANLTAAVITGICEEVGWTGFVTPRLRQRCSGLTTGLIIGGLWGLWHVLPLAVLPSLAYSAPLSPAGYIAFRTLTTLLGALVAFRVIMVWVYDNTQSLLVLVLMHISLTAITMLATPENLSGTTNFIMDAVGLTVMWIVAGIVAAASRRRMHRPASLSAAPG